MILAVLTCWGFRVQQFKAVGHFCAGKFCPTWWLWEASERAQDSKLEMLVAPCKWCWSGHPYKPCLLPSTAMTSCQSDTLYWTMQDSRYQQDRCCRLKCWHSLQCMAKSSIMFYIRGMHAPACHHFEWKAGNQEADSEVKIANWCCPRAHQPQLPTLGAGRRQTKGGEVKEKIGTEKHGPQNKNLIVTITWNKSWKMYKTWNRKLFTCNYHCVLQSEEHW